MLGLLIGLSQRLAELFLADNELVQVSDLHRLPALRVCDLGKSRDAMFWYMTDISRSQRSGDSGFGQ